MPFSPPASRDILDLQDALADLEERCMREREEHRVALESDRRPGVLPRLPWSSSKIPGLLMVLTMRSWVGVEGGHDITCHPFIHRATRV